MSFTWRMEVKDETFTNLRNHPSVGQDYITPNAGVASLDDFSVDGAGNCLEARFRASPKFVDIRARDIVSLEISEDDGVSWTPVYRGYVVTAGNPRSDAIQEYKLVGLRQRFFEITNPMVNVLQNDAADQAEAVFQDIDDNSNWPAGVTQSVPTLPDFGFVNGIRHPQKESYGDTLKAIAESVGRFVVPVGETYTYDGKTYSELETVPAARFGVDGAGNVIFARPQATDAVFSETGDNILAEYTQVTGEEVADTVVLQYVSSVSDNPDDVRYQVTRQYAGFPTVKFETVRLNMSEAIPIPLTRTFSFGDKEARRLVPLNTPLSLMNDEVVVKDVVGDVVNPTGAFSGGETNLQKSGFGITPTIIYENPNGTAEDGFIVTFSIEPGDSDSDGEPDFISISSIAPFTLSPDPNFFFSPTFSLNRTETYVLTILPLSNRVVLPETSTTDNFFATIPPQIRFQSDRCTISNLKIFVPDVDAGGTKSQQFASGFVRDVQQDVAEVTLVNQFGPVAPRMVWTPEGESPVTVPVERIQYTLTTNDGLITQYELGQAFDAELLSERAVLKGLAREAVSE